MNAETLRNWIRQQQVDAGQRSGLRNKAAGEIRELIRRDAESGFVLRSGGTAKIELHLVGDLAGAERSTASLAAPIRNENKPPREQEPCLADWHTLADADASVPVVRPRPTGGFRLG